MQLKLHVGFDWYTCSVEADVGDVVRHLETELQADVLPCRGNPRYDQSWELKVGDARRCVVSWGRNYAGTVLIETTGYQARMVVPVIRKRWPRHNVARVDVAVDGFDGQPFLEVAAVAIDEAKLWSVGTSLEGDWVKGEKGRTLYVGSRKSDRHVCIYEKGKEQGTLDHWTRFELRVRPQAGEKGNFAAMTPHQILALHRFTRDALSRLQWDVAMASPEAAPAARVRRDVHRARQALARQYLPTVLRWVADAGGADAFVDELVKEHGRLYEVRRISQSAAASGEAASAFLASTLNLDAGL